VCVVHNWAHQSSNTDRLMLAHRLLALACARHTQNRVPISNLVEPPFHTGFCHIWRVLQGWSFKSDAFDPVLAFCSHRRRKKDRKLNFFGSVVVKKKLGCFVKETPSTWNQRKFCFYQKVGRFFFLVLQWTESERKHALIFLKTILTICCWSKQFDDK
jgi:hypothetical protein